MKKKEFTETGLSALTREQFNKASDEFEPIEIRNEKQAFSEMQYVFKSIRRSVKVELQISAIHRFMSLIGGGILEYSCAFERLKNLHTGIYAALTSTKSELIIEACFLLSQIATKIKSNFDKIGDYLKPLSFQVGNEVQIISDCCRYSILTIIENCPSSTFFDVIYGICIEKGPKQKAVMAECLCLIIQMWPIVLVEENLNRIVTLLNKFLLNEVSPLIRKRTLIASCTLTTIYPDQEENFFGKLPDKLRLSIQDEEPLEIKERLVLSNYVFKDERNQQTKRVTFQLNTKMGNNQIHENNQINENLSNNTSVENKEKSNEINQPSGENQVEFFKEKIKQTASEFFKEDEKPKLKLKPAKPYWQPYEIKKPQRCKKQGNFLERNAPKETTIDESKHLDQDQKEILKQKLLQQQKEKLEKFKKEKELKEKKEREQREKELQELQKQKQMKKKNKIPENSNESSQVKKKKSFLERCGPKETTIDQSTHIKDIEKERLKMAIKRLKIIDDGKKDTEINLKNQQPEKKNNMKDAFKSPPRIINKARPSPKKTTKIKQTSVLITLVDGQEIEYLTEIQEKINDIPKYCSFSIPQFLFCCSHNSYAIASTAINLLVDLFEKVSFESDISDLLDILFKKADCGNPKLQSVALYALNEIPKFLNTMFILEICCEQEPSFHLLKYSYTLIECCNDEQFTSSMIKHLCLLVYKCYNLKPVKSMHLGGFIIRRFASISKDSVLEFGNDLSDKDLREFSDFVSMYVHDLHFRNVMIDVPQFNPKKIIDWQRQIEEITRNISFEDWSVSRDRIFEALNDALFSMKEVDRTLRITQALFSFHGFTGYQKVLPGILFNKCSISNDIIFDLIENSDVDIDEFIKSLQQFIENEKYSKNAIDIQTKVIKRISKVDILRNLEKIVFSLQTSIKMQQIEIRKSSVVCFAELFSIFGKETMIKYLTTMSKSNRELIILYCTKKNII
ncbi:hypothetical protein TRFO_15941 [Tritrichomonas foetus]|uniref:CLASP N-terminal domain-containing protein n=1 Tax=Tritrichomonas foetus TaxID=1144522 RepID=A0A1J4KRD9_9EUKA|nr:hypothetical protein TRFO_15941 [Tritrichomonas foetus]|eukprot:OHT13819.1 hypothetical protein TRFO_15941 [Tritrichomonas foetus]